MIRTLRETLRRIVLVGISGIDCSGKSTFAGLVARSLQRDAVPATVLHGDEFTRPRRERLPVPDEPSDYYESVDYSELCSVVIPTARAGHPLTVDLRVTDWERDEWRTQRLALAATDVLIVEGPFLFRASRHALFDLSIWLEVDWETALMRATSCQRDLERFGSPAAVQARYETRYFPGQRMHLERDSPSRVATLVVWTGPGSPPSDA